MFRSKLIVLLILLSCTTAIHGFIRPGLKSGSCSLSFINNMRTYDCVGLNLSTIPQSLQSSTEILDVSMNRIRELTNASFKRYPKVKRLYLNDNMILMIESGTFDELTSLETLDLSMNALVEVPPTIFHIPELKQLMLAKNFRLDILNLIQNAVPITAPIKYLDISYSPLLTQLPSFGVFMDLVHLNATGNNVNNVSMDNFVGLCNLQHFTADNLTIEFNSACDCKQIDSWFREIHVKTQPSFNQRCSNKTQCPQDTVRSEEYKTTHEMCRVQYKSRESIRSIARICYLAVGIIGGTILLIGLCYIYHRTQRLPEPKPRTDLNEKKTGPLLMPNNNEV